jgi:hypothetical protein
VRRVYTIYLAHLSRKVGRWRLLLVYHRRQVTSRVREKRQRRMHIHWPRYIPKKKKKKKRSIFNAAGPAYRQPFVDLSPHHTQLTWSDHYQQSPSSPSERVCSHAVDLRSITVNRPKAMQSRATYPYHTNKTLFRHNKCFYPDSRTTRPQKSQGSRVLAGDPRPHQRAYRAVRARVGGTQEQAEP